MATGTDRTTHGSASWHDWPAELAAHFKDVRGKPLVTVGRTDDGKLALYAPDKHLITFAPTRAGKGTSLIIPTLLTWSGSCLVLDPKGENAWRTAEARRAMGQTVHVLDPFGGVARYSGGTTEGNVRFNPLVGMTPDAIEDIRNLAEALVVTSGSRDSHWDNSALDLIEGFLLFEIELALREARVPSLARVRGAIAITRIGRNWARAAAGNADAEEEQMREPFLAASKLARFTADEPTDEISSIYSTAITQTSFLDNPKILASLDGDGFRLADLAEGNTTIYLVLPSELLDTYGRWMRLILSRAIADVARANPKIPVLFMLDEFGTVGRLSMIARALGLMAGEGIRIWAFLQDLSQLRAHYNEWATFISNSGVVQFFGTGDYDTARYLSEYLGAETITTRPQTGDYPISPVGAAKQLYQEGVISRGEFYTYLGTFTSILYRICAIFLFWYARPAGKTLTPLGVAIQIVPLAVGILLISYMFSFVANFIGSSLGVAPFAFSDRFYQLANLTILLVVGVPTVLTVAAAVLSLVISLIVSRPPLKLIGKLIWKSELRFIILDVAKFLIESDSPFAVWVRKVYGIIGIRIAIIIVAVILLLAAAGAVLWAALWVAGFVAIIALSVIFWPFKQIEPALPVLGAIGVFLLIMEAIAVSIGFSIARMVREDEVRKATGSPFYLGLGGLPEAHKSLADDPTKYDIATALKVGLRVRGRSQGNRTALMSQSAQLSQPTRRQLLMPDEAIRLPRNIIVTILKGHPSRLQQAPYFMRTEFNHLYRLLPGENFPERDQLL